MGIAEQDMLGTAAGMATCGKIPYVSTFAVLQQVEDMIKLEIVFVTLN